jgi:hypothetical protein
MIDNAEAGRNEVQGVGNADDVQKEVADSKSATRANWQ